jgi:hypothetical protein
MFLTPWKVITGQNVNQPGHATIEYFRGNDENTP